mgnify:CR=1 FL=1
MFLHSLINLMHDPYVRMMRIEYYRDYKALEEAGVKITPEIAKAFLKRKNQEERNEKNH